MRYFNTPAFLRQVARLPVARKHRVRKAYYQLIEFFEGGVKPHGLRVKKIRAEVWSVRVNGSERILFELEGKRVTFIFAGNHIEYERFLSRL